jgi:glycosyltransferase involved in cell wall biosynthesis
MRRTFRQAEKILVTRDTLPLIPRRWQHKANVQLAVGLSDQEPDGRRQKLRRNSPQIHLLYVGRLLEWKGVDIALRSVGILKQSYPEISLTLIGDGPARSRLIALSRKLGLERNLRWLGWLPQRALADHYRAADILLYPSLRDSGGMVVLEALAHGLPVVCTDLGGPGIIVNSTCGCAIATSSTLDQLASNLAGALLEICSTPNLLEALSYGALVRAQEFRFQNLVQSLYPEPCIASMAQQA